MNDFFMNLLEILKDAGKEIVFPISDENKDCSMNLNAPCDKSCFCNMDHLLQGT